MSLYPIILNEDCQKTVDRNLYYDYVITSPPDFDELGEKPDIHKWYSFLSERLYRCCPKNGLITIFVSDRRYKGHTIPKHHIIQNLFGIDDLLSHKIWVKSYKTNLYRPNFTHILTFGAEKHRATKPIPDVFYDEFHAIGDYSYNFSLDIVKKFILAYTDENDIVFDPFIGSGTTALACMQTNRQCIGVELNLETYNLCIKRISDEQDSARKVVEKNGRASDAIENQEETQEPNSLENFFNS